MRGSAASRGKRGEQRPPFSFLNDYPIASLLAAAIVCTWIVTRTLVFTHLHERASDHIGDVRARDMRQSKIRESGSAAVVQSASSSLLQTSVTSGQSLVSAAATASSTDKSKCHPKKNTLYGGATGEHACDVSNASIYQSLSSRAPFDAVSLERCLPACSVCAGRSDDAGGSKSRGVL